MICILLCAGYATRMYPLTKNFPKPLLDINGKSIIDYLIDDLESNNHIDKYVIVSNHKFINHFNSWKEKRKEHIIVLDDGSIDNDHRMGAVKDIWFAIEKENIYDDVLVLAGDNILDFSLRGFIDFARTKNASCVMRYYEENKKRLQRTGVAIVDDDNLILEMKEKPLEPKSNWAIPPFYIFNKNSLIEIKKGIDSGCNTDAPGGFIEWLSNRNKVYAYLMPGKRVDIGNLDDYYKIRGMYE